MSLPNQPCECGSGKKQKKCHPFGAPVYGPAPEKKTPAKRDGDVSMALLFASMIAFAPRCAGR